MAPDRRASPADEVTRSLSDYQEHQVPPGPYRLYAREYPGVEPTLELLHGFPDNLHLYDRLLPHLHPPRRVITGVLTWDEERGDGGLLMLLLPRGQATDRSRAIEFLQEAVADARAIGMILVCEGFQALQAALAGAMVPAGPAAAEVAAMAEAANNLFRREGQYWTVVFDGAVARLKHTKGLGHLARLLAQPGREFHTLDLEAADGQPPKARAGRSERELAVRRDLGDAGVLLDATAKAAYQARLEELQAELEEAEDYNDPTRAAMARQELDVLVGELARAVGLGGRDRRAASHAERARLNATRAIRAAMANLAEVNPALGRHLAATVRTGRYCCYTPDPRVPITWKLTRDEPCSTKPAGMTPQHPEAANEQPRRPAVGPPADVRERRNNGSPALNVPTVRTRSLGACPAAPLPDRRPDMEAPVVLHLAAGKPEWICSIPTGSPPHRRCAMSSDPELPADADGPVTTTVTRRIKQGHEAAHEAFLAGISGAARTFPGCLGIEIFRPAPGASDEYRTVYRFDSSALRRGCAVLGLFADPRVLKRLLPGR